MRHTLAGSNNFGEPRGGVYRPEGSHRGKSKGERATTPLEVRDRPGLLAAARLRLERSGTWEAETAILRGQIDRARRSLAMVGAGERGEARHDGGKEERKVRPS